MTAGLVKRGKNKLLRFLFEKFKKTILPFKSNRLLIVRLDAIGDYILFRNYIHYLKTAPGFQKYKFTLVGNIAFKDLAEEFDKNVIDEFIWISPATIHQIHERINLVFKLKFKAFDVLINPVHSRVIDIDEFISELGAKQKICSSGDDINMPNPGELSISGQFYDKVIAVPGTDNFEYLRNSAFINALTNTKHIPALEFITGAKKTTQVLQIAIFPGAGQDHRRWGAKHFADVIDIVLPACKNNVAVKIVGSQGDSDIAAEIISASKNKHIIEDKTGQTNLVELVNLINNAHLLITNDTCALHIAAAVKTKAICISNGNHFGRFNPYPAQLAANIYTFYPNNGFYNKDQYQVLNTLYKKRSDLPINAIAPRQVADKAVEMLTGS